MAQHWGPCSSTGALFPISMLEYSRNSWKRRLSFAPSSHMLSLSQQRPSYMCQCTWPLCMQVHPLGAERAWARPSLCYENDAQEVGQWIKSPAGFCRHAWHGELFVGSMPCSSIKHALPVSSVMSLTAALHPHPLQRDARKRNEVDVAKHNRYNGGGLHAGPIRTALLACEPTSQCL